MAGYRFCRTDDAALLVDAYNACCGVHLPDEPPFDPEQYRAAVHEINLWPSSCMVASSDGEPVGVLLAAKRDHATLVHRIGVRPGHERSGHGRHMLASLSSKLAILGPERLEAEIPADRPDLIRFFEACGYAPGPVFADMTIELAPPPAGAEAAALPVTLDELKAAGLLDGSSDRSWRRSLTTLENLRGRLEGMALPSEDGIAAWLLHGAGADPSTREIPALGCAGDGQSRALLGMLVRRLAGRGAARVLLPGISGREMEPGLLESYGFRVTRRYVRYTATPSQG